MAIFEDMSRSRRLHKAKKDKPVSDERENETEERKWTVKEVAESKVDCRNQALMFDGSRAGSISCGFGTRTPIYSPEAESSGHCSRKDVFLFC